MKVIFKTNLFNISNLNDLKVIYDLYSNIWLKHWPKRLSVIIALAWVTKWLYIKIFYQQIAIKRNHMLY
jgi:hypothetical protein